MGDGKWVDVQEVECKSGKWHRWSHVQEVDNRNPQTESEPLRLKDRVSAKDSDVGSSSSSFSKHSSRSPSSSPDRGSKLNPVVGGWVARDQDQPVQTISEEFRNIINGKASTYKEKLPVQHQIQPRGGSGLEGFRAGCNSA